MTCSDHVDTVQECKQNSVATFPTCQHHTRSEANLSSLAMLHSSVAGISLIMSKHATAPTAQTQSCSIAEKTHAGTDVFHLSTLWPPHIHLSFGMQAAQLVNLHKHSCRQRTCSSSTLRAAPHTQTRQRRTMPNITLRCLLLQDMMASMQQPTCM